MFKNSKDKEISARPLFSLLYPNYGEIIEVKILRLPFYSA